MKVLDPTTSPPLASMRVAWLDPTHAARTQVVRSVNSAMVLAYWHIGREIVEYHQAGAIRAEYGDQLLEVLSAPMVGSTDFRTG